jgi:AcrR family transcriptional regulator
MSKASPSPLRRGPADPDAPEQIRTRILDAATACLLEMGVTGRLHAQIAQRAGISRPTVYKYVGDQAAILQAVFDREFDEFLRTVIPQLREISRRSDLTDGVALIVEYARNHELLQKGLRDQPEYLLPLLTTKADFILQRTVEIFAVQLAEVLRITQVQGAAAAEWFFRIIVSLIVTPGTSGTTRDSIRKHLDGLDDLLGSARGRT